MSYEFAIEDWRETWPEAAPIYNRHYEEKRERLRGEGVEFPPFNPDLERYFQYAAEGCLIHYTVRHEGRLVGYSSIYLSQSMHNQEPVAMEDAIYVVPGHRNGIGRKLTLFVLDDLKKRGIKRANMTASVDPRATKMWARLGFRRSGDAMTYDLEAHNVHG